MTPPSVFISYTHDSPEHKDAILALSERLRQEGVVCVIDQYEQSPAEGWPLWCEREVKRANFVLVACTEIYLRRFDGEEEPGKGPGRNLGRPRHHPAALQRPGQKHQVYP